MNPVATTTINPQKKLAEPGLNQPPNELYTQT